MSPATMQAQARRAGPDEAAALTALLRRSKAAWGYPPAWLQAWEPELAISTEYIVREHVVVLEQGTRLRGFFGLELHGPVAFLEHLWVDSDCMRGGFGSKLLTLAREAARSAGHDYLELVADPNAEAFYARHGGIRVGVQHSQVLGHARALPRMRLPT
jgi:GNAT superfamily N-acetyltransferase